MLLQGIIFLVAVSLAQSETCVRRNVSCPDYVVIESNEDFEDRLYPSLVWISTSAEGKVRSDVSGELVKTLYAYLGGENDRGQRQSMMVPVRTAKVPGDGSLLNNYTMSLAVEPIHQKDPPIPTNPLVSMKKESPTRYVVRSFSGYVTDETEWETQANLLRDSVVNDTLVDTSFYFWCVYDSPWHREDRLNEVWMIKHQEDSE